MSAASEPRRMPPKIRELIAELEGAGFGDDAKQYQIRAVRTAIAEVER